MERRPEEGGLDRRRILGAVAGLASAGLAGCAGDGLDPDPGATPEPDVVPTTGSDGSGTADDRGTDDGETATDGTGPDETGPDETETTTEAELNLREAIVVEVELQARDGAHRFSVTLYHDDDGEDGYADWWQVETVGGERLGRRELLHAHSTAPFTRSETVEVPDDVDCVIVRGHDQTHGYGGQTMLVNVETGETKAFRQGADRRPTDAADCP